MNAVVCRQEIAKARDTLRSAELALGQAQNQQHSSSSSSSTASSLVITRSRLLKQKRSEFADKVAEINAKVDRLNMIVPTLYQQIARFDTVKEMRVIATQCGVEQTQQQQQLHDVSTDNSNNNNAVRFTDVLRQLKQLFS